MFPPIAVFAFLILHHIQQPIPAAAAVDTPGALLAREAKRRLISADILVPVDMSGWERAEAAWENDPSWTPAKEAVESLDELRKALVGDDEDPVEEIVRALAGRFDLPPPGDDVLAARYEALRAALNKSGASLEPETDRLRGADGAPLDERDWRVHLEALPAESRRRLFTVFGASSGIAATPPKDPLAIVAKKPAAPKVESKPTIARLPQKPAPPPKKAKALDAPALALPGPKSVAMTKLIKALRGALDAPSLSTVFKEDDKGLILAAWEKALEGTTDDAGKTDFGAAVNGLRDLLAKVAAAPPGRWGATAAASYNLGSDLGPRAALAAAFATKGAKLGAQRLISSALALGGGVSKPKDEAPIGKALDHAVAVESAAATWAASLPNAKTFAPVAGTIKTFKLEGAVKSFKGIFGL